MARLVLVLVLLLLSSSTRVNRRDVERSESVTMRLADVQLRSR